MLKIASYCEKRAREGIIHLFPSSFNGDLGWNQSIDTEDQQMEIQFGERTIPNDFADLNELALAYAITIGSPT